MNPRPLGYEPYDARLRRLARSLVAALTSVNGRGASMPNLGVSRVASYPAASRAQIRAQIWLLTRAIGPWHPGLLSLGHFVIFKNFASSAWACAGVWLSKILSK